MSSAPLLIDTTIDGKPRKVVAVPSKQGWLYCFDRVTGRADLADRREAGSADDDEARTDGADPALPDQAGAVRAAPTLRRAT